VAGPITPINSNPFLAQTVTLNQTGATSTTVIELDPQPYSNTKEVILYNISQTDPVLVKTVDLYGVPASIELNFNDSDSYNGQGGLGLRYQDPPGFNTPVLTQVLFEGTPIDGDLINIDTTALIAPVSGVTGNNTAGSNTFTDAGGFGVAAVGWQLYINGSTVPFLITALGVNTVYLSQPIPDANVNVSWTATAGGPPAAGIITLTADANAIVAYGTNGSNAAGAVLFTDPTPNAFLGAVVGDSLYIGGTAYVINGIPDLNTLQLIQLIAEANTGVAWKINKQFTFSAPTVPIAQITVNAGLVPVGSTIVFTRSGRPDIVLESIGVAPTLAYLPPSGTNPGRTYFDGVTGGAAAIALSIQQAINNIPEILTLTPTQTLMPLGRADAVGNVVTIYGINSNGRTGTLDTALTPWASRTITGVGTGASITIAPFTSGSDANVWPDSSILIAADTYASRLKNIMWNVYKALIDPGNGLTDFVTPILPPNMFSDLTNVTPTIKLVASFVGTNGNNLTLQGVSPAPPSPPATPHRVYANLASTADPENFTGGVDALPSVSSFSLGTSLYLPAASAITLSIGSEGNRQPLATSSFWFVRAGSKLGIVLRAVSGTDVQVNVTFVQNRGYPDGV
jgi:hypothetical protein